MDILDYRNVLAYDKLHHNELTIFERMLVHQYVNLGLQMSKSLHRKVILIHETIKNTRWSKPETRYSSCRAFEVFNTELNKWEAINELRKKSIYDT